MGKKQPLYPHVTPSQRKEREKTGTELAPVLPPHVTGPASTEGHAREVVVREQLAKWIDTYVIADLIIDHVKKELDESVTFENCKQVWLRQLETLGF